MIEIERKFLVVNRSYRDQATKSWQMVQGFLSTDPKRVVRIRQSGTQAWMTVKGKTGKGGTTRMEWEYEIPMEAAEGLLKICLPVIIRKIRYEVPYRGHTFEVDEFQDENEGLTVAEVELTHADERFERPDWLGEEVTGRPEYYNSQLSAKPFTTWE